MSDTALLRELVEVYGCLDDYLSDFSRWDSLIVNRRKPHTYRAFTLRPNGTRICLHRFEPCEQEEAFAHPHPWPAACKVLKGVYRMRIGFSEHGWTKPDGWMTTDLSEGSTYAMTDEWAFHSVQPLTTCYSLMINHKPFDCPHELAPTTKGKDLDKMTEQQLWDHLGDFKDIIQGS